MFLTKEDPRAFVKGSRDPLGLQPIWYRLGRNIIANLTTQSNSVRGFTILLLGRYLAERLLEDNEIEEDAVVDVFLNTEQIAAYVRYLGHKVEGDIRGIDRVRAKSQRSSRAIPISSGPEGMILSNQKIYGLWGLFSSPARVSGLLEEGPIGTTPDARRFVEENYWPSLQAVFPSLRELICRGGLLNAVRPDAVFTAFSRILTEHYSDEERVFYAEYLRDGMHVTPSPIKHQKLLVQLMTEHIAFHGTLGRTDFVQLCELARERDERLHARLDQILRAEAVFAIAMIIFEHMLSRDGHSIADVARSLSDRWGNQIPNINARTNSDLLQEIEFTYPDSDVAKYFDQSQCTLQEGRFGDLLEILTTWNASIQARRGSAPWILIGPDNRLDVRYRSPEQALPTVDELPNLWRYSYFLSALQNVTLQLTRKVA